MSKVVEVHLEWKYTPPDYLEDPIIITEPGIHLEISQGVAIASIEPATFENNSLISDELTKMVENRLYAVQFTTHKKFSLSEPSRSDLREDGGKNVYLKGVDFISFTDFAADLVVIDKDGKVTSTKQERLKEQGWLIEMMNKYRSTDKVLDQMLESYKKSVHDPDNEFVYLYEIRERLKTAFNNSEANTKQELNITQTQWSDLGNLANNTPVEQSRHRGKFNNLRAAEFSELEKARKTAVDFIKKYLDYLDKSANQNNHRKFT